MGNGSQRIRAIDTLRGISIFYMVIGHAAEFWLRGNDIWFPTLIPIFLDMIGSSMFIFLAGISLTLSYSAKQRKVERDPMYLQIHANIDFLGKTLLILVFAFIYNIIASTILLYGTTIWIWFVLLSISLGRLCCYPFLKLNPLIRIIIGLFFFSFADFFLSLFSSSEEYSIIYYLLFNGTRLDYPFPFFGFFFIGSALGQWIGNIDFSNTSKDKSYFSFIRYLVIFGLALIIFGILIGQEVVFLQDSFARGYTNYLNTNPLFNFKGLYRFVLRSSTPWGFYCEGFQLIILAGFLEINRKNFSKKMNKKSMGFVLLGQNSLTIYIIHYISYLIYLPPLTIPLYFIVGPLITIAVYLVFWIWANKGKGKGTVEWLMKKSVDYVNNRIHKK